MFLFYYQRFLAKFYRGFLLLASVVMVFWCTPTLCQKSTARYEIEAKRAGVSPIDKDALPRGREFIRLDSTYYTGYLFQGVYLFDRSSDKVGFERALPLVRKGFFLLQKDFSTVLQTIYTQPFLYIQNNQLYTDFLLLGRTLKDIYEYLDRPDSSYWVLSQIEKYHFRRDFFGVNGARAWMIHRNRFFTSNDYGFLKNSVAENEAVALAECYKGIGHINKNLANNNDWFGQGHDVPDKMNLYHYLGLIHGYLKNYDSSEYYYNAMANAGMISWNNYGSLKSEMGQFKTAIDFYTLDKDKYSGSKTLMEPYYYLPILNIYAGKTKAAIHLAQQAIRQSPSTPGFGWYNIALARSYLYDGQLDSANLILEKAAHFKEIHIGTTLTQHQYDFTILLLKSVWYEKKLAAISFEDKNWWFHLDALYEIAQLKVQQYLHNYALATNLLNNPERNRIVYDLFCGESTVSFDEVYSIMERYSPVFFTTLMQQFTQTDPRPAIRRYFALFNAKLLWKNGLSEKKVAGLAAELLQNQSVDRKYEQLYLARAEEMAVMNLEGIKQQKAAIEWFRLFPQLIPFSGYKMSFHLQFSGNTADPVVEQVVAELKNCNINWMDTPSQETIKLQLKFQKKGNKHEVMVQCILPVVKDPLVAQKLLFQEAKGAGKAIAYCAFGVAGASVVNH